MYRAVGALVVVLAGACDRPSSVGPTDALVGDGTGAKNDEHVVEAKPQSEPRPPTQESCEANAPKDGCHWTLVPTSYCGGPPPTPEMTWPHCACEACATDAHCGAGQRCVLLATDAECHPAEHVCVEPGRTCTPESGCHPDEQCMSDGGKPRCKIPTMYPPRP
ncbi:MAG TPA: hypothetical protein VG755_16155 [Nannocystaceae bacterium]|nr:hypothetical protein [Nannocystaceae bacterium]